jgi:hypothetical protein
MHFYISCIVHVHAHARQERLQVSRNAASQAQHQSCKSRHCSGTAVADQLTEGPCFVLNHVCLVLYSCDFGTDATACDLLLWSGAALLLLLLLKTWRAFLPAQHC